ncbi:MAG: hypothetical protein WA681_14585 [Candidatus Acidiferrales bacterium]
MDLLDDFSEIKNAKAQLGSLGSNIITLLEKSFIGGSTILCAGPPEVKFAAGVLLSRVAPVT